MILSVARRLLPMLLLVLLPTQVPAAGAARLDFVHGDVRALSPGGQQRSLSKASELAAGDTLLTGSDGRAQLRFSDGAMISLQPNSEFRLDTYQFSGRVDGSERGFFSLLKGGLRTLTGLIGRANRDSYRLNTAVATIGIRGTEFTVSYLDPETIAVSTGEGRIEVCNQVGCVVLASGASALVTGKDAPRLSFLPPVLSPPQPFEQRMQPVLAMGDGPLPALASGGGYRFVYSGFRTDATFLSDAPIGAVTAGFDDSGALVRVLDASGDHDVATPLVAGGFSLDGVIGWGRWRSGTGVLDGAGESFGNLHYLIGKASTAGDLAALGSFTANYRIVGSSFPTDQNGNIGSAPSGNLQASFSAGAISALSLNMSVPINGNVYQLNSGSWSANGASGFSMDLSGQVASGTANGFFAGAAASHAGIGYQFQTMGYNAVTGVVVLKR